MAKKSAPAPWEGNRNPSAEEQRIAIWMQKVRFRKHLFGGVMERDVWKKLGELQKLYEQALVAERARYDALLAERAGPTTMKEGDRQ